MSAPDGNGYSCFGFCRAVQEYPWKRPQDRRWALGLAHNLAFHADFDSGGECFPGREIIRAESGLHPEYIVRAKRLLVEAGFLTVFKRGRGLAYQLHIPGNGMTCSAGRTSTRSVGRTLPTHRPTQLSKKREEETLSGSGGNGKDKNLVWIEELVREGKAEKVFIGKTDTLVDYITCAHRVHGVPRALIENLAEAHRGDCFQPRDFGDFVCGEWAQHKKAAKQTNGAKPTRAEAFKRLRNDLGQPAPDEADGTLETTLAWRNGAGIGEQILPAVVRAAVERLLADRSLIPKDGPVSVTWLRDYAATGGPPARAKPA